MQTLDQRQGIKIERPDVVELRLTIGGLDRFDNGLHHDAFPYVLCFVFDGPCFPAYAAGPYGRRLKIGLNCRIKIRFICDSESYDVDTTEVKFFTLLSP